MAICGYQTSNGKEHVIFINADSHVYELVYSNDKWGYLDLTKKTGAPNTALKSPVVGYQTSNGYEHINYIGNDNHVHELIYTGQWRDNDLTVSALKKGPAPNAVPGSALDAYQTSNGYVHVNFIGEKRQTEENSQIYELIYTDHWKCNNISNGKRAGAGSGLTGYQTPNGYEHVNYIDSFVYELIYTDQWKDNDLHLHVVGPGQAVAGSATPLKGLVTSNGKEHVFYIDARGGVHELIYTALPGTSQGWFDNTLGGTADPTTQLTAYQTSNGYEHVNYVDLNGHVHELIYTGQWKDNDLTTRTKPHSAPVADSEKGLAGYQTSNGYEHVNYMDAKYQVYELIYAKGQWAVNNLRVQAKVPAVAEMSLAGD